MALNFPSTNKYRLTFPNIDAYDTPSMSISAWVNVTTVGSGSGVIMYRGSVAGAAANTSYNFAVNPTTGKLYAYLYRANNVATGLITGTTDLRGALHHVALTYSTSDLAVKLFVDGVQEASATQSLPMSYDTSEPISIGGLYYNDGYTRSLGGSIFDARLYNTRLSADEIGDIALCKGRDSVAFGNIVLRACLKDGYVGQTPTTVYDHSVNKNHGTAYLSPTVAADPYPTVKGPRLAA